MIFAFFYTISASPSNFKLECQHILKEGRLFNGKESVKFTEFAKNMEKAVGYKLNQNQITGLTKEIEKADTNENGRLELQEMIDLKLEKSYLLKMFEIVDKNQDGFYDLSEIRSFTLVPSMSF
jgi:Ca2+-binding EF-hand superfamily protein